MNNPVTLLEVATAADLLLSQGERPSIESVRKVLGRGSPATINSHLKDYYKSLPDRLNLPPQIASAAIALLESIRNVGHDEIEVAKSAARREVAEISMLLESERSAAEAHRSAQTAALEDLKCQVDQYQVRITEIGELLAASQLEARLQSEQRAVAIANLDAEKRLREIDQRRNEDERVRAEQASASHIAALEARLAEQAAQVLRLESAAQQAEFKLNQVSAQYQQKLDVAMVANEALNRDLLDAKRSLATSLELLDSERTHIALSKAVYQEETSRLSGQITDLKTQLTNANDRLERSMSLNEALRAENSQLVIKASMLEGRAVLLAEQLESLRSPQAGSD